MDTDIQKETQKQVDVLIGDGKLRLQMMRRNAEQTHHYKLPKNAK